MVQFATARRNAASASIGALSLAIAASLVPVSAQAQDRTAEYEALLQEISDRTNNVTQREFYLEQQQAQIDSLRERIAAARSADAQAELRPILDDMVEGLERVMTTDLPFRTVERFALLDDLRDDLRSPDASLSDGFRRALDLYSNEVELGLGVSSYTGNNPVADQAGARYRACLEDYTSARCGLNDDQLKQVKSVEDRAGVDASDVINDFNASEQLPDGNYIHYGRLALFYLERDSSVGYRYDMDAKAWQPISNSDLLGLRQNVRIARGESAVATMTTPIKIGERAADAS